MSLTRLVLAAIMMTSAPAISAQTNGADSVLTLKESDAANGVIAVKLNQKARILLPTNSSTGYEWSYGPINNIGIDSPVTVFPAGSSGPYGSVGQSETALSRIQFRGLSGGANITFLYTRHLANGTKSVPAKTVRFSFRVEP